MASEFEFTALTRVELNDAAEARRRLDAGKLTRPSLILAQEQTAGRGRRGREWASPPGNVYLTFGYPSPRPPAELAILSPAAGLAWIDALAPLAPYGLDPAALALKWPNDLLYDGAKLAGILLEYQVTAAGGWLLLGTGLNRSAHPPDTPYPATHLAAQLSELPSCSELAQRYGERLHAGGNALGAKRKRGLVQRLARQKPRTAPATRWWRGWRRRGPSGRFVGLDAAGEHCSCSSRTAEFDASRPPMSFLRVRSQRWPMDKRLRLAH